MRKGRRAFQIGIPESANTSTNIRGPSPARDLVWPEDLVLVHQEVRRAGAVVWRGLEYQGHQTDLNSLLNEITSLSMLEVRSSIR